MRTVGQVWQTFAWVAICLLPCATSTAQVERVWLSHRGNDPSKLVVRWTTKQPGDSLVLFGKTKDYGQQVLIKGSRTFHQVEIPLAERDTVYHYSVQSGDQQSEDAVFQAYPTDELRVAVVADWQGKPDLSAIMKDRPHLLLTAGDNISRLWQQCGEGNKDCYKPYAALIDAYPALFRSTPFMPVLGNHDREIRPRTDKPPTEAVYDIDATAFRSFFALPDDEWKWHFDLADFDLRLIALDFNHVSDFGTTWQTCHAFDQTSEQFQWYKQLMEKPPGLVITLYNERNASVRNLAQGEWQKLFQKGTCNITGYGHFAERAELDGVGYYNTSLHGKGARYGDPHSKFLASENSYLLLTVPRAGKMTIEIKNLQGKVLDHVERERRE